MHLVWAGKQTTELAGHREKKDETKRKITENKSLQTERQIQTYRQSLLGQA